MQCCSVNKSVRSVDMQQAPTGPVMNVKHNAPPHAYVKPEYAVGNPVTFAHVENSSDWMSEVTSVFSRLGSLFTSLFNRLASSLINKPIREPVATFAQPELNHEAFPDVVPEPAYLKTVPVGYIPGLSMKRKGEKANDIWGGFRQGEMANCVTVSAIKAAMHRYGQSPTDIYQQVSKVAGGYRVVMRDDFTLTLTDQEFRQGARGAGFLGADREMLKDAQFLYAVSAKRAQMENNDGTASRSFQAAIFSLNDMEDEFGPGEGFKRLGLSKHMRTVNVRELARGQVGMSNRGGHSVAVINGREELWGEQGSVPREGRAVALV